MKKRSNLQTAKVSGSQYTEMNSETSNISLLQAQDPTLLSGTYHQSCKTIPIGLLFEVMITGDLTWLCISGNPLPNKLEESWESIVEEYMSLIKTEKTDDMFQLYKKIKQTQWLKNIIDLCLDSLKVGYDPDLAKIVSEKGFGVIEYVANKEIYLRSIKVVEMSAKTLVVILNQYITEYESLNKNNTAQSIEMSENERRLNIEKEIATLSRFQKDRINKQTTTAFEYAAILNNYLEYKKNESTKATV